MHVRLRLWYIASLSIAMLDCILYIPIQYEIVIIGHGGKQTRISSGIDTSLLSGLKRFLNVCYETTLHRSILYTIPGFTVTIHATVAYTLLYSFILLHSSLFYPVAYSKHYITLHYITLNCICISSETSHLCCSACNLYVIP